MKMLVLGGGAQGRVIANDLAQALPAAAITVADVRQPALSGAANLRWQESDLADVARLEALMAEHDQIVGALPSHLGFGAMCAAIAARRNLVDVSFCAEDALALDADARRAGVTIVPDCGLAPGLSHLCVGRAAAHGVPDDVVIDVGGVAEDPSAPYGYVVTWSLPDLEEEYVREARIVRDGVAVAVPALSELVLEEVPGVGAMEAFLTDGLRTLLATLPGPRSMVERTLRWPGHVAAIRPLLAAGTLVDTLRERCSADPPRDRVVMRVRVTRGAQRFEARLDEHYDPATKLTAMARTTALTTSAVAQLAAAGALERPGVQPLERIGSDAASFDAIARTLASRGVNLSWSESS